MNENQAIAKIAAYCAKAERCRYDVCKKLTTWELSPEVAERIIKYLEKENFLNEERFCQSFIKDKLRFNKWGKNKIVFELRKKQISETLIHASFEELDIEDEFEAPLMALLEKKVRTVKAANEYELRMKLARFAAGRGFGYELVQKCLHKLLKPTDDGSFF
ncbi:RecX family transcriptional regulator [Dysgonomonas sp. 216]|uniref:regulatory protein RecX n=1 Tax=Dysgonomonas sp. 216 TaxID=2302934 RepID=UPI0013D556F8|nr:regulatory protein RecX [Dysgonomonas sp. 216]NDW17729.1 RecX family transcriptional regulator [Dysgonomonas sp. 216]